MQRPGKRGYRVERKERCIIERELPVVDLGAPVALAAA